MLEGGGLVVRWSWVNFQCRAVLQFGSGWLGGAMVLGKLPVPGRPTLWMIVGQGPMALALGAGCLDIFTLFYPFIVLSPLWETARCTQKLIKVVK